MVVDPDSRKRRLHNCRHFWGWQRPGPPYGLAGRALGLRPSSLGPPWPPYGLAGNALGLRTASLGTPRASVRSRWELPALPTASLGAPCASVRSRWERPGLRTVSLGAPWAVRPVRPVRTLRPVQLTVSTSGNIQNGCHMQQNCCSTVGLETLKTACECCRTASIQNCLSMESTGAG